MTEVYSPGDTFETSGGDLLALESRVSNDPRWHCPGWRVTRLNGGLPGTTEFRPDHLVTGYRRVVIGQWAPVVGVDLESRWVREGARYSREYRRRDPLEAWTWAG